MKTLVTVPLCFIILLSMGCSGTNEPVEKERKAIFIIADGISADVLEQTETPNIDSIIENGGYTRGWLGGIEGEYSESPTVSAVGYNHILTGVWSNKHNVYTNDIEKPNYNYWNIFRLFKHHYPEKPVAVYSSWTDNRTKLIGDGLQEAGNLKIDIHRDGFDTDTVAFPHESNYIQRIDDHVSTLAAQSIRNDGPYLSWIYLWYPDATGHEYGEVSEHFESVKVVDQQIGKIRDALTYRMRNYDEEWLLIITTDHGRRLPDGKDHGTHTDRERTIWMVSNLSGMNSFFYDGNPPVTSIYPTIARYLNIPVAENQSRELDGIPMIGNISVSDLNASVNGSSLNVDWTVWDEKGNVDVYLSTTNIFKDGGNDKYIHVGTAAVSDQNVQIDISEYPSDFYKVVLKAPDNTVNRWIAMDR